MTQTPPEGIPHWDTGDNNSTDPGTAKKAAGWALNEVPASNHLNWLLQQGGQWVEFLQKAMAPEIFRSQMTFNAKPFTTPTTATGHKHIKWSEELSKYLAIVQSGTGGSCYLYESLDGLTWTNETLLSGSASRSQLATDGTSIVAFTYEAELHVSTTGSVADIAYVGNGLGALTTGCNVVWDAVNGYFVANIGRYVVTNQPSVQGTPSLEANWTDTAHDFGFGEAPDGLAVSNTGIIVAVMEGTGSATSDDGGQTWSSIAGSNNFGSVVFSPATDCFFAYDITGSTLYMKPDSTGTSWTAVGIAAEHVVVYEDFALVFDGTDVFCLNSPITSSVDIMTFKLITPEGTIGAPTNFMSSDLGDGISTGSAGRVQIHDCTGASCPALVWTTAGGQIWHGQVK